MYIASASTSVKFHELFNNNGVCHYQLESSVIGPIRSISWSKDGYWLALVPHSGLAEIITVKNQLKLIHTVKEINEPLCAAFQNTTKKYLAIGTRQGQVLLYDIKSRTTKKRFYTPSSIISHVGFIAKDTHCFIGCSNGDVLLYNNASNVLTSTFKIPKSHSLTSLKPHPQKRNFLTGGSNEGIIAVWDINTNKVKFSVKAHKAPVTSIALSPINSLAISTGLDRQFCIYDVGVKERIACVPVANNITAVDFIDDATYFAMASQNGKIHMYDSRHFQQPIYSVDAHEGAIKHLSFQKSCEGSIDSNSSMNSLSGEEVRVVKSAGELNKTRTSDIFGYFAQIPSLSGTVDMEDQPKSLQDSFMVALGLDKENTIDLPMQNESKKDTAMMIESKAVCTPNATAALQETKTALCVSKSVKVTASTPKVLAPNFVNDVSPIVTSDQPSKHIQQSNPDVPYEQFVCSEVIENKIQNAIGDLKAELLEQIMHSSLQIRRMMLNFQLSMVKEFITAQDNYNSTKTEILSAVTSSNENFLMQENISLRNKIQILENQIANLTTNKSYSESV